MLNKVVKLIIYYIISVNNEKDQNFEECLNFTQLLINIANDDMSKFDNIINNVPEEHPIKVIYKDIKNYPIENYKQSLIDAKQCIEKYSKDNSHMDSFSKLQENKDVDNLVDDIIDNK